jgi:hypothetical protein
MKKFEDTLARRYPRRRAQQILELSADVTRFEATPLNEFMDLLSIA